MRTKPSFFARAGSIAMLVVLASGAQAQHTALAPCWKLITSNDHNAAAACIRAQERALVAELKDPNTAAELLALKGSLARATGDFDGAEAQLTEALALCGDDDRSWTVRKQALRVLGNLAYEAGDYHKGLVHFREMLVSGSVIAPQDTGMLAGAHYNIGNCYWGLDVRDSCRVHYEEALRLWGRKSAKEPPHVAYIHEVLGTYAWEAGDEQLALHHFNEAARRQLKDAPSADGADALLHQANLADSSGRADEALALYEQALAFRERNLGATHPNTACMHSELARMLGTMGRSTDALGRAQHAIHLLVPGFDPDGVLANPKSVQGTTSHRNLLDALLVKFDVLRTSQEEASQRSADEVIDLCIEVIEHLRTRAQAEGSKLFWTHQVRGFIEKALEHCLRQHNRSPGGAHIDRALSLMELGHNALLAEAMRDMDARRACGLPDSLADAERELKQRVAELRRYVLLEEKKCERMDVDKVGIWRKAVAAGEAELDRLVLRLEKEYPLYHEVKYASSRIEQRALLERLGSERSILCMFQGEQALYMLLLDDRGARFVKDERVNEAIAAVHGLRAEISDRRVSLADPQGSYERFTKSASFLYELFFGPYDPGPHTTLIIMPDGDFHRVPFDVLLTVAVSATGRDYSKLPYLIKQHTVHVVPLLHAWARMDVQHHEGGTAYVGFAPDYSKTAFAPLRGNAQEVSAVHELLGGSVYIGAMADEASFKRYAGNASVLHLAMHTATDAADPTRAVFAFGAADSTEDGVLTLPELTGLALRARLALLSACGSGDGPLLAGEGVMSLARSFQYAGCPSVVMNLWASDDATSAAIIARMSEELRSGAPLNEALRTAKLEQILQGDPTKAHPFYWSTLVLVGDERPIELHAPWYKRPVTWIITSVALLLLWFRRRLLQRAQ